MLERFLDNLMLVFLVSLAVWAVWVIFVLGLWRELSREWEWVKRFQSLQWGCLVWFRNREWKPLQKFRSWLDSRVGLPLLNSFAVIVIFPLLLILFFAVLETLGNFGLPLLGSEPNPSLDSEPNSEKNNIPNGNSGYWERLTFLGLLAALAGILSVPLAIIRVNVTERRTRTEEEQTDVRGQEYTTNLLNQATEHLGANLTGKDSNKPNIPRRIGGLLTLERIARENIEDYHLRIMTMICAYIRENSPYSKPKKNTTRRGRPPNPVREDIQIAVDILARRTPKQVAWEQRPQEEDLYRLNLNNTNLTNADFTHRNLSPDFSYAYFQGSYLKGADLVEANLSKAEFYDSMMMNARLTRAKLQGADLAEAHLKGATVTGAEFDDDTKMEGTKPGESVIRKYVNKEKPLPSQ